MISHSLNQDFVAVRGEAFARPAAVAAARAQSFCLAAGEKMSGAALSGADITMERGAAAQAAGPSNGPVSVECGEQDRREGTGFRAGAFPCRSAEARLRRALCAEGA